MRPVNPTSDGGESWGDETSNLALQDLRSTAIADLNKRDEQLSRGRMNAANGYSPYREVPRKDGRGTNYKVDPVLCDIKHTGEETLVLTKSRWADFCEQAQQEKPYTDRLVTHTRDKQLAKMKSAGTGVEASLAPIDEAAMPVMPKAKPKRLEPALPKV